MFCPKCRADSGGGRRRRGSESGNRHGSGRESRRGQIHISPLHTLLVWLQNWTEKVWIAGWSLASVWLELLSHVFCKECVSRSDKNLWGFVFFLWLPIFHPSPRNIFSCYICFCQNKCEKHLVVVDNNLWVLVICTSCLVGWAENFGSGLTYRVDFARAWL